MILTLMREPQQPSADCTLGLLLVPDASLTLCTIERPWIPSTTCRGGAKYISCVPPGRYQLVRHDTVKKPRTWALVNPDLDVLHNEGDDHDPDPDRTDCLLHVANFAHQLEGCIAPGLSHVISNGLHMVTSSTRAMDLLRAAVPWIDGHELVIR